jgi:hypothetical protein
MQKTSVFSDFYCLPNKLALMGLRPGLSSSVPAGLILQSVLTRTLQALRYVFSPIAHSVGWKCMSRPITYHFLGLLAGCCSARTRAGGGQDLQTPLSKRYTNGMIVTCLAVAGKKGKVEKGRTLPSSRHPRMRSDFTICSSGVRAEGEKCGSPRGLRCG